MKHRNHIENSSNYMEITIYNKTKETENRIATGKATKEELIKYKNVIRTEVKVKNGKLNSNKLQDKQKSKTDIRTKDLANYYNNKALHDYYSKSVRKIFGIEPFYRIDVATKIIEQNADIKPKMKDKLISLINLINSNGYTEAKSIWVNTFSLSTFNLHIKKIRALGINIITYDPIINGIKIDYEYIPNFSLLDNCEIEFLELENNTF